MSLRAASPALVRALQSDMRWVDYWATANAALRKREQATTALGATQDT